MIGVWRERLSFRINVAVSKPSISGIRTSEQNEREVGFENLSQRLLPDPTANHVPVRPGEELPHRSQAMPVVIDHENVGLR